MGIQKASSQDTFSVMVSAITNYNHLVYILGAAAIAFVGTYYMTKKSHNRMMLSIIISLICTFAVALYFVWSTLSQVRY